MTSPLVVIVGETASGKSALALELAQRYEGEIICADSRTVYKGMDIGTAKPTLADQEKVQHYGLDLITPDCYFSAAQFQHIANEAIGDITRRGKLPILVGGTGLYVDSILFNFTFPPAPDSAERERLSALDVSQLQSEIIEKDLTMPSNSLNKRHLARVIETNGIPGLKQGMRENTLVLGLRVDREELRMRIEKRVEMMISEGFLQEVEGLGKRYGFDAPGMLAPGYRAFAKYLTHEIAMDEAAADFIKSDLALAKRQRTWFKRNNGIQWLDYRSNYVDLLTTFLNKSS